MPAEWSKYPLRGAMHESESIPTPSISPLQDPILHWRLRAKFSECSLNSTAEASFWRQILKVLIDELKATQGVVWHLSSEKDASQSYTACPASPVSVVPPSVLLEVSRQGRSCSAVLPNPGKMLQASLLSPVRVSEGEVHVIQIILESTPLKPGLLKLLDQTICYLVPPLKRLRDIQDLRHQADHDPLTNLPNRRALKVFLRREIKLATRHTLPLSLVMVDLDHFKKFNDTHGHIAGDRLLTAMARALQHLSRSTDCVARYGGEEFVVVLPHTDQRGAGKFAHKLLAAVQALSATPEGCHESITASIGTATWPDDIADAKAILTTADHAMYTAKRKGRNQVYPAYE
ncbi:MAG: GGDEF domain-containing protein [Candidatus Sericytochromatia bacterium]|nr:GGDEF domain-containing protein [Candidatus Sericytochromatia bacterium]